MSAEFRAVELHDLIVTRLDADLTVNDVQNAIDAACSDAKAEHGTMPDPWMDHHWHQLQAPVLAHLGLDYDEIYEVAA